MWKGSVIRQTGFSSREARCSKEGTAIVKGWPKAPYRHHAEAVASGAEEGHRSRGLKKQGRPDGILNPENIKRDSGIDPA
jgi:hypothetical protein